jgi:hypothetical protein
MFFLHNYILNGMEVTISENCKPYEHPRVIQTPSP